MITNIKKNKGQCKHCGDVIESTSPFEYVSCSCGAVILDGGQEYIWRSFKNSIEEDYEDMSEYTEVDGTKQEEFEFIFKLANCGMMKMLMDQKNCSIAEAKEIWFHSGTYKILCREETKAWYLSTWQLFDVLKDELETGEVIF